MSDICDIYFEVDDNLISKNRPKVLSLSAKNVEKKSFTVIALVLREKSRFLMNAAKEA